MRRRTVLILGVVIVLAGMGGVVGVRWWHNRPPYGPEVLNARATLQLVDQATADAALAPGNAEHAAAGDQIVLGRVTWSRPPDPQEGGSFRIVLLDKRSHRMPGFIAVTSPRPGDVSTGSDGALDLAAKRAPWLRGAGTQEVDGSFVDSGNAIFVQSVDASPVTFQTVFHPDRPDAPTGPVRTEDLLVALISVGPDSQVYWTQRLLN